VTAVVEGLDTAGRLGEQITVRISNVLGTGAFIDNVKVTPFDLRPGGTSIATSGNLINDGDFEQVDLTFGLGSGVALDSVAGNYTSTVPTGWTGTFAGTFHPSLVATPAFQDTNVAYVPGGGTISQTIASPGSFDKY